MRPYEYFPTEKVSVCLKKLKLQGLSCGRPRSGDERIADLPRDVEATGEPLGKCYRIRFSPDCVRSFIVQSKSSIAICRVRKVIAEFLKQVDPAKLRLSRNGQQQNDDDPADAPEYYATLFDPADRSYQFLLNGTERLTLKFSGLETVARVRTSIAHAYSLDCVRIYAGERRLDDGFILGSLDTLFGLAVTASHSEPREYCVLLDGYFHRVEIPPHLLVGEVAALLGRHFAIEPTHVALLAGETRLDLATALCCCPVGFQGLTVLVEPAWEIALPDGGIHREKLGRKTAGQVLRAFRERFGSAIALCRGQTRLRDEAALDITVPRLQLNFLEGQQCEVQVSGRPRKQASPGVVRPDPHSPRSIVSPR
jgi:hypothetical protein